MRGRGADGFALAAALLVIGCGPPPPRHVVLATTSSVQNSGLLDRLGPAFRGETGIEVRVHQVGSGRALQMLKRGLAGVAISHAPAAEAAFLREFPAAGYQKIMFNDFVVVGPKADPAGVRGSPDVVQAFRTLARAGADWLSRGDESGTHERERDLWAAAGAEAAGEHVFVTGQGMAATLRHASARHGYTLSDRATFLQLEEDLDLAIVFAGDDRLMNTYAVVTRDAQVSADARAFHGWLTTGRGVAIVAAFEVKPGIKAFTPWPAGCARTQPDARPCLTSR